MLPDYLSANSSSTNMAMMNVHFLLRCVETFFSMLSLGLGHGSYSNLSNANMDILSFFSTGRNVKEDAYSHPGERRRCPSFHSSCFLAASPSSL